MSDTKAILQKHLQSLQAQKQAVIKKTAAERAEREKLFSQMNTIKRKIDALTKKINADKPELVRLSNEISTVARALGGLSMSQSAQPDN